MKYNLDINAHILFSSSLRFLSTKIQLNRTKIDKVMMGGVQKAEHCKHEAKRQASMRALHFRTLRADLHTSNPSHVCKIFLTVRTHIQNAMEVQILFASGPPASWRACGVVHDMMCVYPSWIYDLEHNIKER